MGYCLGPFPPCVSDQGGSRRQEYRNPRGRPKSPFPGTPNRKLRSACAVSRSPDPKPASEVAFGACSERIALLLIYRYAGRFSMQGSEMYLNPKPSDRGNWV